MEVYQEYYGLPPPPVGFGQPLHLSKGDIIELTKADADLAWWEVGHARTQTHTHKVTGVFSKGILPDRLSAMPAKPPSRMRPSLKHLSISLRCSDHLTCRWSHRVTQRLRVRVSLREGI